MIVFRQLIAATAICSLCVLSGCGGGGPKAAETPKSVKGVVTLDGTPLTEGTVNFSSAATGNGAIAKIGADGKFEVTGGVVPGEYKVTVTPPTPTPDNPAPKPSTIPEKYRNEATTDLSGKIINGSNDLKFELKS